MQDQESPEIVHQNLRKSQDSWVDEHDLLLAMLVIKFGYDNYQAIVRHPVWLFVTAEPEELDEGIEESWSQF